VHRPIRRKDREISIDEASQLLAHCPYGVLATVGADGQPYAVPVSYVFHDRCIYFHCADEGHKLDNIRANQAVSFCVVGATKTLPNEFATEYESAVAFGTASEIDDDEKREALVKILEKYSPDFMASGAKYITGKLDQTTVVKIDVDHISGKARR
jgi:uncharacterized protein